MPYPERFHKLPDDTERETRQQRQAFMRMHIELVHWGKVLLGGAIAKDDATVLVNDEPPPKIIWTPRDESRAWATDRRVNLLEARNRLALRVFYRGREAEYWDELEPAKQCDVLRDMCRELNARWRGYCASYREPAPPISWYAFESSWRATVYMLARTAEVPFPQHPCG
jgi:hypothetical protein